jgi:hypothetical protein
LFKQAAKNRWQAFGAHLLLSLCLFIAMCIIIVVFWYPGVLFTTEGGWQGVRLIAAIDFIIGPTLTLLVYKPGKKGLKFDLAVIGILQAFCISYGMYVVHYSRPAVVAYAEGIFYTTPLLRFDSRRIDVNGSELLNGRYPIWVNIKMPESKEGRLMLKIQRIYDGLETSIDLYEPYALALPLLLKEGISIQEARSKGYTIPDNIDEQKTRVFKLITRYNNYAVAVNIETGTLTEVLGVIPE